MPSDARREVPGSIGRVSIARVAPRVMAATGALTIAEAFVLDSGRTGSFLLLVLGAFLIPTLGTTCVSWLLARQRWGEAAGAAGAWFLAHALLALLVSLPSGTLSEMGIGCALVASAVTAALASPAFVAAGVLGRRSDSEAGDTFVGVAGLWFLLVQLGEASMVGEGWWVTVPGLLAAAAGMAHAVRAAVRRRSFVARAARGEVSGWRVRAATDAEARSLPPLFGSSRDATAVLERVEAGPTAYRSGLLGVPVARVGGAAARLAATASR